MAILTVLDCILDPKDTEEQAQEKVDFLTKQIIERKEFIKIPHKIIGYTKVEHLRECAIVKSELQFLRKQKKRIQTQIINRRFYNKDKPNREQQKLLNKRKRMITPSKAIFNEMKCIAIGIWRTNYDDEHGYVTEKIEMIDALENIQDNAMIMFRMFDPTNQGKFIMQASKACKEYITNNQ